MKKKTNSILNLNIILFCISVLTADSGMAQDKAKSLPVSTPGGAQFIKQHPKSDANKDGILTRREKEDYCSEITIQKLGGNYTFQKVMIPMRDGIKLATAIFIPKGKKGPFPAVMCRTAYEIWMAALANSYRFANQDIVYISQDLRGDGESEGKGTADLMSFDNEINDGYDTIEWVAKQSWCNGRVGMLGTSGHGFCAYMAYLARPPHLTVAWTNVSGGNAYLYWANHNGVRREMYNWFYSRSANVPQWPKPTVRLFDKKEYMKTVAKAAKNNKTVFLAKTGWYDIFGQSALDYFEAFGKNGRIFVQVDASGHGNMIGKKFPPKPVPPEWKMPDLNEVLKNPDAKIPAKSRMVYYLMGDVDDKNAPGNCYKMTEVWPVPHKKVCFYLKKNGSLDTKKPKAKKASLTFKYDPRNPVPSVAGDVFIHQGVGPADQRVLKDRKDILRFVSEPLKEPMEITGKVMAELYISSDVDDTTFTAKLIDIYPDGYEAIVRDSIVMGRFHQGFDKSVPLEKGKVYKLTMDMWSTALVVNKGHRIAVHISSSNHPKYEVHPNSFKPIMPQDMAKAPVANNTIHLSADYPTHIILPVVQKKDNEK